MLKKILTRLFLLLKPTVRMRLILWDTVRYYSVNPLTRRAVNEQDSCRYYDENTRNMCAVGRVMIAPELGVFESIGVSSIGNLDTELRPAYRGLSYQFWVKLQLLHDLSFYWNDNGLTQTGEGYYAQIKQWIREQAKLELT